MATEIEILLGKVSNCEKFHPENHFKEPDEAEIDIMYEKEISRR